MHFTPDEASRELMPLGVIIVQAEDGLYDVVDTNDDAHSSYGLTADELNELVMVILAAVAMW